MRICERSSSVDTKASKAGGGGGGAPGAEAGISLQPVVAGHSKTQRWQ